MAFPGPFTPRPSGPGSVKYERSWGIEESLEQFQGLVRQHPGGGSWEGVKVMGFPTAWHSLSYIIYEYAK